MNPLILAAVVLTIFCAWAVHNGRKLRRRIARIRKIHGPEARICYMNKRGKRYTWEITIESVRPRGADWAITAWCHDRKEFLIFYASRMYEYSDLIHFQDIKNVPAYFTERFKGKGQRKSV